MEEKSEFFRAQSDTALENDTSERENFAADMQDSW